MTAAEIALPDELAEIAATAFEATVHGGYHRLPTDLSAEDRKLIWAQVFNKRRSRMVRPRIRNRTNQKKLPFPDDATRRTMIDQHIQTHGINSEGLGGV